MTLGFQRYSNNHTYIRQQIRKHLNKMTNRNWEIKFKCVKSHAGVRGNELTDTLPKEAGAN